MITTPYWVALLSSFVATYFGAISLNTPRKFILPGGLIGSISWLIYVIVYNQSNNMIASFVSSVIVALLSNISAKLFKAPVTIFFIPAFLPIVPGLGVYRTLYFYIINQHHKGYENLVYTLETSVMIAIAIVLVDSLFRTLLKILHLTKKTP